MKINSLIQPPNYLHAFSPPSWCQNRLINAPSHRLSLANLPTPLYRVQLPEDHVFSQHSIQLLIKRDDATGGVELGGNKVRKLEFLLAQALRNECDSVVTIGGAQSNHCRATAAAARMLGLYPHVILRRTAANKKTSARTTTTKTARSPDDDDDDDVGMVGNLLVDRMVGTTIYTCTPGEYGRLGSEELIARVCKHIQDEGIHRHDNHRCCRRPYAIPVGGSNALGTWGYIVGVDELLEQLHDDQNVDHVVVACGSGGTASGIALGFSLAWDSTKMIDGVPQPQSNGRQQQRQRPLVHAMGVCDTPEYFYGQVAAIARDMGLVLLPDDDDENENENGKANPQQQTVEDFVRTHLIVHQSKGLGYAISTDEELGLIAQFAQQTGVVLDPVYTGKAWFHFERLVRQNPLRFAGQTILFWHTGGALGLFDKVDPSSPFTARIKSQSLCNPLDVYGKGNGIDISRS